MRVSTAGRSIRVRNGQVGLLAPGQVFRGDDMSFADQHADAATLAGVGPSRCDSVGHPQRHPRTRLGT